MNITDYNKEAREWLRNLETETWSGTSIPPRGPSLQAESVHAFAIHLTQKAKSEEKAPEKCGAVVPVNSYQAVACPNPKPCKDHESEIDTLEQLRPDGTLQTVMINRLIRAHNTLAKKLQ